MGEYADDAYEGLCCYACGQYFIDGDHIAVHGYAVLCEECWNESTAEGKHDFQKSLYKVQ